jgi:sulfur-oxidizing protein SoxA
MIKRQLVQLCALFSMFAVALPASADQRQSATALMTPSNQAMQNDMNLNPALFWIMDGEALWDDRRNPAVKACSDCHQDIKQSMKSISASFPKRVNGKLLNLEGQINQCRTSRQQSPAFAYESKNLLSLSTLIAYQSRGLPIAASTDPAIEPDYRKGQALYFQRMGQLNLSCAQCHDDRAGLKLASSTIPQGHPTAYPIYRIEWQGVGSLQRRLRSCVSAVRAEQYVYGSPELLALELYLMRRATGMQVESPGVRP